MALRSSGQIGGRRDRPASLLQVIYRATAFAPFMVATPTFGGSRPLYRDVYTIGEHGK
jgi:hypothetical protein